MNLSKFYDAVARNVDTAKTQINAAETRRVLSVAFKMLSKMDNKTMLEVLARGVAYAAKKKK